MKKLIQNIRFCYDYYVGSFLHAYKDKDWHIKIIYKYPEKFKKEIEYIERKKKDIAA
jgi:hypothetical protein